MVNLWFIYGLSMVNLWFIYGLSMVYLWFIYLLILWYHEFLVGYWDNYMVFFLRLYYCKWLSGCWFGTWLDYDFPIILGISSSQVTNSYFSEGLKPPTSIYIHLLWNNFFGKCLIYQFFLGVTSNDRNE